MKKILPVLLAAALLLFPLSACGDTEDPSPSLQEPVSPSVSGTEEASVPPAQTEELPSARELVNLILTASNDGGVENLESFYIEEDRELLSAYIENAYGLQDSWEDAAVLRAKGASSFEIAVLRMGDEDAAARAAEALKGYLTAREGDFTGYAPAEADMAANGEIRQSGAYVVLFICPNAKAAASAFEKNLDGGTAQVPGGEDGPSETDAKLAELLDEALDYCAEYGEDVSQLERLDYKDSAALESYIKDVYGVSDEVWETCQGAAVPVSVQREHPLPDHHRTGSAGTARMEHRQAGGELVLSGCDLGSIQRPTLPDMENPPVVPQRGAVFHVPCPGGDLRQ